MDFGFATVASLAASGAYHSASADFPPHTPLPRLNFLSFGKLVQMVEHPTNRPRAVSVGTVSASRFAASTASQVSLFGAARPAASQWSERLSGHAPGGASCREYERSRERWTLIEICRQPEFPAPEVTLQPVHRDPDAAIMFADIMLPLLRAARRSSWSRRRGRTGHCLAHPRPGRCALRPEPEADVSFVLDAIRPVRQALGGAIPLIGFSGAPFTLASYLIEGAVARASRTLAMMYGAPTSGTR